MPITTSPYELKDLMLLAGYLHRITGKIDEAIEAAKVTKKPIWIFNKRSQEDGLKKLLGFERELSDALVAFNAGKPFTDKTLKPRARESTKSSEKSRDKSRSRLNSRSLN